MVNLSFWNLNLTTMRFNYENLLYKITFDGTILKYTKKRLLRWLTLSVFDRRQTEFPVTEISACKTKNPFYIFKTHQFELARWNQATGKMSHATLSAIYLFRWHESAISDLSRVINHETMMDKRQQTWFIPRDYGRMVG